jgi:RES domain-containing protein
VDAPGGGALRAWRLVRPAFADPASAFSGEGARRYGGRWNSARPVSNAARAIGDAWLAQRASVALSVPSVLVPQERNLLLDPAHPRFPAVIIGPPQHFRFDDRR